MTVKIAYLCDGKDICSMQPGCFMREEPLCASDWCCNHTCHPEHAATELCEHPEEHPERFYIYRVGDEIRYFEKTLDEI